MRVKHIKHEILDPIEYYFCDFKSEADIKAFESTCPWFSADELSITPGEICVIKHNTSDPGYYEKLPPRYFLQKAEGAREISQEIYVVAREFFG